MGILKEREKNLENLRLDELTLILFRLIMIFQLTLH